MSLDQILIVFIVLWLATVSYFIFQLKRHYSSLTGGVSKKDLLTSLNHFISMSNDNADTLKNLSEKLESEILQNKKHLQKLGFNRYNPFTDTGGDQSFSMSLLDENGDGIVISSLHSRENTRLYAKKVLNGKVDGQGTSVEEQLVIKEALK